MDNKKQQDKEKFKEQIAKDEVMAFT